jgi:hypothetical protein
MKGKLKAFVRFDGSGRVISSSLILQKNMPKVGNWKEIEAYECCNTPTTTVYPGYIIGQHALGGTIAYILQEGDPGYDPDVQHGLITTVSNITTEALWGCMGTLISGADGIAIGTGAQNTIDIIADCTELGIAAKLCNDLIEEGYNDWYLPSSDELTMMYNNRVLIGNFDSSIYYWSSTEYDNNGAMYLNFSTGGLTYTNKVSNIAVRAIRRF